MSIDIRLTFAHTEDARYIAAKLRQYARSWDVLALQTAEAIERQIPLNPNDFSTPAEWFQAELKR